MEINIAKWVKSARTKAQLTQEQLAEKLSMTKANISAIENERTTPSFLTMLKICDLCDVSLPSQTLKNSTQENAVIIEPFSMNAEFNFTNNNDYFKSKGGLSFSKDWLSEMGINPTYCFVIYAKGVSMSPTLEHDQAILIDTSQKIAIENKIYLIAREQYGLIIKRISRERDGSWLYISDNVDKYRYPTMFALKNDKIIGRVVWTGGSAGL